LRISTLGLPDASGFDIIQQLTDDNPAVKVVIFSMYEAPSFVTLALEKGAKGYITKDDDPNAILVAIDRVMSGSIFLGHTVAQTLAISNAMPVNDPLRELNERERQIVKLLGEGTSLTEISVRLALGYKTVANTVTIIKQKLGVPSTPRLIKYAVEIRSSGRGGAITYWQIDPLR
jgi:DNA-binding NarL/FixJ family response regulator